MKETLTLVSAALLCAAFPSATASAQQNTDEASLYQSFQEPSASARPRVWWHWMNGNISKDGIRKDLHWMHDAGVVGFHNFDAGLEAPQIVDHRITYMTPEWKDCFRYALSVADSLGMEVTIASSPGWSETGGPWVKEEDGMKKIVWRQVDVQGERQPIRKGSRKTELKNQSVSLPEGFTCSGGFQDNGNFQWATDLQSDFYRDIAVIGVKLCDDDIDYRTLNPRITASSKAMLMEKGKVTASKAETEDGTIPYDILNGDSVCGGVHITTDKGTAWIQYEFDEPQTVKSVVMTELKTEGDIYAIDKELQCSDDGKTFRKVATLGYQATLQRTWCFPAATARIFRVVLKDRQKMASCGIAVHQFMLSSVARIQDAGDKAGFGFYRLLFHENTPSDSDAARLENVVDLTGKVKDGVLEWQVPDGRWRIFRFGYSLTGKTNHPASPEATGLEVDKLDPKAIKAYYNSYLQTYQDASDGKLGPNGISYMLTDSYEAGPQTWTENMPSEFMTRKGYDLMKWLPALTGMTLESTEATERFLFDWRRCIGEMISEYHYDQQNEILAQYGMKRYTEAHENYRANLTDGMDCKHKADVPMSAFWMSYNVGKIFTPRFEADIRESASVAHIYGQNIAAAESFTSDGIRDGAWVFSPSVLKPTADAAMASGLNRYIIHCSPHQPVDDKLPGLGLGKWGQWFDRNQTWADQAKIWTDYLSRSCEMLQKGRFVADIAVYYGEDNNTTGIYLNKFPRVPAGYNYDYFNPTVLKDEVVAENGMMKVPSGMTYKVLLLDDNIAHMSIEVLRKLKTIADAGVVICGEKPSIRATNSGTDEEFKSLVDDIWNSGRVNVSTGVQTQKVLLDAGIQPDVEMVSPVDDSPAKGLRFVHRALDGGEIYWIANQTNETKSIKATFRTSGKKPMIWHAEDGSKEEASFVMEDGRTTVDLNLTPYLSDFIVFMDDTDFTSYSVPEVMESELLEISTPWKVAFQEKRGAPESIVLDKLASLSENADPGVRYFSGVATYTNSFKLSRKDVKACSEGSSRIMLDLGEVKDIAEVYVNGEKVATVWHSPYKVDVSSAVRKGENSIEVKVVNMWHNRIVGDMQPETQEKVTWFPLQLLKGDEPLLQAGLIGPVSVFSAVQK